MKKNKQTPVNPPLPREEPQEDTETYSPMPTYRRIFLKYFRKMDRK